MKTKHIQGNLRRAPFKSSIKKEINDWVCNECNFTNFTASVSNQDIMAENLSCINCGGFEFHKKAE